MNTPHSPLLGESEADCALASQLLSDPLAPCREVKGNYADRSTYGGIDPESDGVLVCTIEKANQTITGLLEEENMGHLSCIVVDELHMASHLQLDVPGDWLLVLIWDGAWTKNTASSLQKQLCCLPRNPAEILKPCQKEPWPLLSQTLAAPSRPLNYVRVNLREPTLFTDMRQHLSHRSDSHNARRRWGTRTGGTCWSSC